MFAAVTFGGVVTALGLSVAAVVLMWLLLALLVRGGDRMSFFDWWCWNEAVKVVAQLLWLVLVALFKGFTGDS